MSKKVWSLGKLDLFRDVSEDKIKELEKVFQMRKYNKNEIIFDPTDCCKVYIVKTGRVEMYHLTSEGKKVIIDILDPSSIFADLGGALSSGVFVETIDDSYIYSAEKSVFFEMMSKEPIIAERLMKHLFTRVLHLEEKTSSLAVDNVSQKFIKLLLTLGKRDENEDMMYITDKYTHEQLAQMIGVSRQTLTSVINQLEKQDIISRSNKRFQYNKEKLRSLTD